MKNINFFIFLLLIFSYGTSTFAREMECRHDYLYELAIVRLVEAQGVGGDLSLYERAVLSPIGGTKEWLREEPSPTKEIKYKNQYKKIGKNLYYMNVPTGFNIHLSYIDFSTAKYHQMQWPSIHLSHANELPMVDLRYKRFVDMPVHLWKCQRLD